MEKEEKELQIQLAKEDRELQIKLAQLQSDINFRTSVSLGYIAIMAGFLIAGYQFIIDGTTTNNVAKIIVGLGFIGIMVIVGIFTFRAINRLESSREELRNLK
jgi:hypothetical protein